MSFHDVSPAVKHVWFTSYETCFSVKRFKNNYLAWFPFLFSKGLRPCRASLGIPGRYAPEMPARWADASTLLAAVATAPSPNGLCPLEPHSCRRGLGVQGKSAPCTHSRRLGSFRGGQGAESSPFGLRAAPTP